MAACFVFIRLVSVVSLEDFLDVGEILEAACGLFGEDEIRFSEIGDENSVLVTFHPVFPCFVEYKAGYGGEDARKRREGHQ